MTKNKVYVLEWDDNVRTKFEELQKSFAPNEKLLGTAVHDNKFVVTTEILVENVSPLTKQLNLLLD